MSRLSPQNWKTLECVFLLAGFEFVRQASSHRVYEKDGVLRPVIIPTYDEVGLNIIQGLLSTAGLSREQYKAFLDQCK